MPDLPEKLPATTDAGPVRDGRGGRGGDDHANLAHEHLGRRIAAHRAKLGLTQQELADRLAVSRVTVSHLEAGMSTPGERTVTLLAGLFKVEPHELVAGTSYPVAKMDRLPLVATRYTEVEHQLEVVDAELELLDGILGATDPATAAANGLIAELVDRWEPRLAYLESVTHDRREREELTAVRARLRLRRSAVSR